MTCRLFIDEVGNSDLEGSADDPNVRYLSLTGIIIKRGAHDGAVTGSVTGLKQKHFADPGIVLHRREIIRREGVFAVLRAPFAQAAFDADLLNLFDRLPYLVHTVTMDKREHLERYSVWHFDPYHYCLRCLIERYVLWLNRNRLTGDVVAEPRFKKADKKLKSSFQTIYDHGTDNIPRNIVQRCLTSRELKFEPKSANVAGLQICDLLAYPSYRHMKFEKMRLAHPHDFGNEIADLLLGKKYARHPRTRVVAGVGRKWLP
jgi:Protein of unknown function (DUF3800)